MEFQKNCHHSRSEEEIKALPIFRRPLNKNCGHLAFGERVK
jgi:hypothetical protein